MSPLQDLLLVELPTMMVMLTVFMVTVCVPLLKRINRLEKRLDALREELAFSNLRMREYDDRFNDIGHPAVIDRHTRERDAHIRDLEQRLEQQHVTLQAINPEAIERVERELTRRGYKTP